MVAYDVVTKSLRYCIIRIEVWKSLPRNFFKLILYPWLQNTDLSPETSATPTKSTLLNNFCSSTLSIFASLAPYYMSCIYHKCSMDDIQPMNKKIDNVLEQKLFGRVDSVKVAEVSGLKSVFWGHGGTYGNVHDQKYYTWLWCSINCSPEHAEVYNFAIFSAMLSVKIRLVASKFMKKWHQICICPGLLLHPVRTARLNCNQDYTKESLLDDHKIPYHINRLKIKTKNTLYWTNNYVT